jgi:hypothetical protein
MFSALRRQLWVSAGRFFANSSILYELTR